MAPISPAITIHSPPQGSALHSHVVLLIGSCNPPPPPGSQVTVTTSALPQPHVFPVHASGRFKALARLIPGDNVINIACGSVYAQHHVTRNDLPNRPVDLIIVAGADSRLSYDDVKPTTIDDAIRRFRMAACLWQAYTAEQMLRNGFGPRTFPLTSEWGPDTVAGSGEQLVPKVTIIRSKSTVAQIRDTNRAQQNKNSKSDQSLFDIAGTAVSDSQEFNGRKDIQAVVLILDATKTSSGLITGHAALGGSIHGFPLAIFGSHTCFAWPSCIDEVVPCFLDRRPVDTRHCGIDCEGDTYGMAANVGIGAMMHEVGHALGCPHQSSGVMLRDYVRLHKSFIATDNDSDECAWHRLDTLRFVSHPSFVEPWDPPRSENDSTAPILMTTTIDGIHFYTPSSRLLAVECRKPGKETTDNWSDLSGQSTQAHTIQRADAEREKFDRITVLTSDGGKLNDMKVTNEIYPQQAGVVKTPLYGAIKGQYTFTVVPPRINHIRVYCGYALDGIEFDGVLWGKRGGSAHDFKLNNGETIYGFNLRHGGWVDAIQIVTNMRVSQWFGRGDGGGPGETKAPGNYRLAGVYGYVDNWVQSIGFEYVPSNWT